MANVTVTSSKANVTVTDSTSNITVTDSSNNTINVTQVASNVTVGETVSNIVVSNTAPVSNTDVRTRISVSNLSGFGNLAYDNSATSNGVIQYTGVATSDIRGAISNTAPILYDATTGVISANTDAIFSNTLANNWFTSQTTDNLTEGSTNFYYTNERVRDTIANTLVAGANITITNDDANNTTTIAADLTGDITGVTAGSGLTGGGTTGDVTLDVGTGYGITVNADSIELTNSEVQAQANIAIGNNTTDNLSEGSTNLYYTQARFDTAFSGKSTTDLSEGTNLYYTNARANAAFVDSLDNITTAISSNANITTTANIEGAVIKGSSLAVTGDSSITGNLNVTGNINSETVTDLFVEDRNITLQFGQTGTPSANSQIFVDRGSESNSYIKWDEPADAWKFSNDGSTEYAIPTSTSDLAEGTNLYFTNARANAAFVDSLDNITTAISSDSNITTTANISGSNILGTVRGEINTTSNITTTGNLDVLKVTANIIEMDYATGTQGYIAAPQVYGPDYGTNANTMVIRSQGKTGQNTNLMGAGDLQMSRDGGNFPQKITIANATNAGGTIDMEAGNVTSAMAIHMGRAGFYLKSNTSQTNIPGDALLSVRPTPGANGVFEANLITVRQGEIDSDSNILTTANIMGTFRGDVNSNANITTTANIQGGKLVGTEIDSNANITTTANISGGNVLTDHVISDSSQSLQLKGQANGIQVDKTISSTESRIFDADTSGYSVASADLGAFSTNTSVPSFLCGLFITAGGNTGTSYDLSGSFGLYLQKEGVNNSYTNVFGSSSLQNAVESGLGVNAKTSGWQIYSLTDASSTAAFPAGTYIESIVGNTVTFSQNALKTYGASSFFIMSPGVASSNFTDLVFRFQKDIANASLPYKNIVPVIGKYEGPEVFGNVTMDYASYTISGDTIDLGNVVTRNHVDINSNPDSAIRTDRALLIGANATVDINSIGKNDVLPSTSTLGVTVEQDGLTDFGSANLTPQMKFMMNQYKDNSISSLTEYPAWTEFLGQSGNTTVDLSYIGAPNFNFKIVGGNKDAKAPAKSTDVLGRITFNEIIPGVTSGADNFYPPASITARAPGDTAANLTVANADIHIQSTYSTSARDGSNIANGSIPRTFVSSNEGNTVIASKPDGQIELRPQRDYGDEGNASSFVANRFPHELHEYHTFLSAGFDNKTNKTGTTVTIQDKVVELTVMPQ